VIQLAAVQESADGNRPTVDLCPPSVRAAGSIEPALAPDGGPEPTANGAIKRALKRARRGT
jgi:hypothetical protein